MKIYASPNYQRLLAHPLFEKVTDYLLEKPAATLRELKSQFDQKGFDHYLDTLVQAGLVERAERRYQLAFPLYKEVPLVKSESDLDLASLLKLQETIHDYFFAVADDSPAAAFMHTRYGLAELHSDKLTWVYIGPETDEPNIPIYFQQLAQEKRPNQTLYDLLGDVDPHYFMRQIEKVLPTYQKGRIPKRPSIFWDALTMDAHLEIQSFPLAAAELSTAENAFYTFARLDQQLRHFVAAHDATILDWLIPSE